MQVSLTGSCAWYRDYYDSKKSNAKEIKAHTKAPSDSLLSTRERDQVNKSYLNPFKLETTVHTTIVLKKLLKPGYHILYDRSVYDYSFW